MTVFLCTKEPPPTSGWVVRKSRLRYDLCAHPCPTVMAGGLLGRDWWIEADVPGGVPLPPLVLLKDEPRDSPIFLRR